MRATTVYDIRTSYDDETGTWSRDPELRELIERVLRWRPPQRDPIESRKGPQTPPAIGTLHDLEQGSSVSPSRFGALAEYLRQAAEHYRTDEEGQPYPERNADALAEMESLLAVVEAVLASQVDW